jgi:uncharacterized membrane protein YbhN (UPF0104 family)
MRNWLVHTRRGRLTLLLPFTAAVAAVLVWRAPDLDVVAGAFTEVRWQWVAAAIGMNLVSVIVRSIAWDIVLREAIPRPHPRHRYVFSAFCVGLLGNAVLPGRVGEVARMAVLARHVPERRTAWAPILGSTFAHRLFDVPPTLGLVVYVLVAARIPGWALPGVEVILGVGAALLLAGFALAWWQSRHGHPPLEHLGRARRLWHMILGGLRIFRSPGPALAAAFFQLLGWTAQVFAVYLAFFAFQIEEPIAAAAVVLLVANVALAFPLWPGSVGLFQAGVALALVLYGVAYQHGFAYGIGLQAIEMSVGVGLGLLYLAREGISFAILKQIPKVTDEGMDEDLEEEEGERPRRVREPAPQHEPV